MYRHCLHTDACILVGSHTCAGFFFFSLAWLGRTRVGGLVYGVHDIDMAWRMELGGMRAHM